MVGDCELHSGDVLTMSWIADQDIPLPTVIELGSITGISTRPIKTGETVGININGGIYRFISEISSLIGQNVYFNVTTKKITNNPGSGPYIGKLLIASNIGSEVLVMHIQQWTPTIEP